MTRRGRVYESLLWLVSYSCTRHPVHSSVQSSDRSLKLTMHIHRRHCASNLLLKSIIPTEITCSVMWPNFSYKWIDSRIIGPWVFPYAGNRTLNVACQSCRFICVSKKSRKYFSLFLSIHMLHLDADWINPVSFSGKRFFNWTEQYGVRWGKKLPCAIA